MSERSTSMPDASGPGSGPARAFSPAILKLDSQAPSPLPRALLWTLTALVVCALIGASIGRLDMIAVAHGRLVPQSFLKIVQPAEAGVVRELLVQEGDAVEAGQVLVRMDPRLSDADAATVLGQLQLRRLQLRRIDAEFSGGPFVSKPGDPPELFAQVGAQYRARRQSHLDATCRRSGGSGQGPSRSPRRAGDGDANSHDRSRCIASRPKAGTPSRRKASRASCWRSNASVNGSKPSRNSRPRTHRSKACARPSPNRSVGQHNCSRPTVGRCWTSEPKPRRTSNDWRRNRNASRSARINWNCARRQRASSRNCATHTAGTVVQPGTVLMTVVPRSEAVQAEVWIDQVDAGFVREQLPAQVKVATFPFQKYGMVGGRVRHLSPDASDAPTGAASAEPRTPFGGTSGYRALIALDSSHLERDGQRLDLAPGMQVSAEIHLGTRSGHGVICSRRCSRRHWRRGASAEGETRVAVGSGDS